MADNISRDIGLTLEWSGGALNLDDYLRHQRGFQVLTGLTGFGLPPVSINWQEGAGDGASFRNSRVLPRDIDLPLLIQADSNEELGTLMNELSLALSGEVTLRFQPNAGLPESWTVKCRRTGGGSYVYGKDNHPDHMIMWITLRAGDPFWERAVPRRIWAEAGGAAPFLNDLLGLRLGGSQLTGTLEIDNTEPATAYPIWRITGPFTKFTATSPNGEVLEYAHSHSAGETVTLDAKRGTAVDQDGTNVYDRLSPAPKFWALPPGLTVADVVIEDAVAEQTTLSLEWFPRRWMVV